MPLPNELEVPQPLDGLEIKQAICYKIYEAVMESLNKHCALYGKSYPKFKASFRVTYELDNFGPKREGNVSGEIPVMMYVSEISDYVAPSEPLTPMENAFIGDVTGEIPETPPNILRKETDQPVPTMVTDERGKQGQKAVIYQPKNRRRP